MKKYKVTILTIALGVVMAIGAPHAFGKKGGGGTPCGGGCSYTTSDHTRTYNDGKSYSDGGGGGFSSGGGGVVTPPPPPPPPPVCTITSDKTVIGLGTSVIHLSWKPVPTTNVSLQRQAVGMKLAQNVSSNASQQASIILAGGGGTTINQGATTQMVGKVLIAPPSSAESFDDTVNVALQGAGTNMTTVISKNGSARDQQASIILAGGGGTTVTPGEVIKTAVAKDGGTITYNLSFNNEKKQRGGAGNSGAVILAGGGGGVVAAPVTYTCSVTVKVVAKVTECNDGIDNADPEDTLIDQQDPGCHTDGNPANPTSYDPTIVSETNNAIDLIAHITAPQQSRAEKPLQVSASAENISAILAPANTLVTGWRNTGTVGTPSCGPSGSQCFTANGHSYIRMGSLVQSYLPHILQFMLPQSFTPPSQGSYEVCAVADYYNVVDEGVVGEANNVACQTIQALAPDTGTTGTPGSGSGITGPISFSVSPTRIKRGTTATLTWNTGGRTKCAIRGINGQVIDLSGAASAATRATSPIMFETKYTLSCADDSTSADATVKLIPQYQEI